MTSLVLKVRVNDLQPGMFVSSLDRPWLESPFPVQGFPVKSTRDRDELGEFCNSVYVDVRRSRIASIPKHILSQSEPVDPASNSAQIYALTRRRRPTPYPKATSRKEEMRRAKTHCQAMESVYLTLQHDARNNRGVNLPELKSAIEPMVRSVVRNPDAYIWLTHLKSMDKYDYHHALSCAVLAVAFGRHLGLPMAQLNALATGCFLFDIGKAKLPGKLLNNTRRLSRDEFERVKQHVNFSLDILGQTRGIDNQIRAMIQTHHERYNGGGYPAGLSGDQIPLFGRIAGMVDAYDAITSQRPYCQPIPAYRAIDLLYQWRGIDFQSELVEQFIQVVGIYPVGSLVELSNGTVGVVICQNEHLRLHPQVMILLDSKKQLLEEFYEIDLRNGLDDQDPHTLSITRGLPPGAYKLDPRLYYF